MIAYLNAALRGGFAVALLAAVALAPLPGLRAQPSSQTPEIHARQASRLIIRNAMVIYGSARPPYGPVDIVAEEGTITYIGAPSSGWVSPMSLNRAR